MAVLKFRNESGKWQNVAALKGEKGDTPSIKAAVVAINAGETPTVVKSGPDASPTFTFKLPTKGYVQSINGTKPDSSGNVSIEVTGTGGSGTGDATQHISNRGQGEGYIKLATMSVDNAGNYGNLTLEGRIGGWEQGNVANYEIMMINRSAEQDGRTITATVSACGRVLEALSCCDVVVYRQDDRTAVVYFKVANYWIYDIEWNAYQHSVEYDGTLLTDTPAGTLIWSLSEAPKTIVDVAGNLTATSFVGTASKATADAAGNVIADTYATKANVYTKSESNSRYIGGSHGTLNVDKLYNAGNHMVAEGSNCPSGSQYGVILGMPYRKLTGNSTPDYGCQIFIPNGDDNTKPNSMFFRTSLKDSWNEWQEVATKNDIGNKLDKSGGNITGHLYLTGAVADSSTSNTSQIVFGTADDNHVAISSNEDALIINPTTSDVTNQVVIYATNKNPSEFPSGITTKSDTGKLVGTASRATADASGNKITDTYATKTELSGYIAKSGSRGTMAGYNVPASTGSAVTINASSNDDTIVTAAVAVTIANGSANQTWTKTVSLQNAGATVTLSSSWKWMNGNAPEIKANSILVVKWCGTFGLANLISGL